MESLKHFLVLLLFFSTLIWAETEALEEKYVGIKYFRPILGHVHQSPERISSSLTTIQCQHPVQVWESNKVKISPDWQYVQVGDHKGFILTEYLADKREDCFISIYPRFFDALVLDITELYFWGRLNDQYVQGDSKVP